MWATWIAWRTPKFKTHVSAATCKGAITNKTRKGAILTCDCRVYRWDNETSLWVEVAYLPAGSNKADNEWFRQKHAKAVRGPSAKAVDAAIASILNTDSNNPL